MRQQKKELILELKIEMKGIPPNKQQLAHKRNNALREKLVSIKKEKRLRLIDCEVTIRIDLYYTHPSYIGKGYDNLYVGDLDNLVSGICDNLKEVMIKDDSQIMEIHAKKHLIENQNDVGFSVTIIY